MSNRDVLARLAAAEVLTGLYDAVADHTQFDGMLKAMDDFLDADPEGLEAGQADWKTMFRQHFSRAGRFVSVPGNEEEATPILFVDNQVVPAAVVNARLDIIASNALFDQLCGETPDALKGRFTTPADARRFDELAKANASPLPVLVSFSLPEADAPFFVVAQQEAHLTLPDVTGPLMTLKVAKATWNPDLVPLLETAYGLTLAEIEVLEAMVELGAIAAVAERRRRSVRTVRTQLTHIYGKLGLSSQTELALFLATLTQLMTKQKRPSDVARDWSDAGVNACKVRTIAGKSGDIAYVQYGDSGGLPVLMVHTTTPPQMIPSFREACHTAGLKILGVHKPGSGGYSARPPKDGPEDVISDYIAILDHEGIDEVIVAGHCSGGLYALTLAAAISERVRGVVLVDTGVPFKGRGELMALPKSLRRTFLPARYIPEVLLVPHRIFASNFKRSPAGEARVVDYFFQDNPHDQNLTRTDRTFYEITRQIIAYSFEDVDRLVADVCRWARDWSGLLASVSDKPLVFIHGSENRMFEAKKIDAYVERNDNASLFLANGQGQLQVYESPQNFTAAVISIARQD